MEETSDPEEAAERCLVTDCLPVREFKRSIAVIDYYYYYCSNKMFSLDLFYF